MHGITALNRDIFLDDKDDPAEIEIQWKKMLNTANKKGYAGPAGPSKKKYSGIFAKRY